MENMTSLMTFLATTQKQTFPYQMETAIIDKSKGTIADYLEISEFPIPSKIL